jgi:hypothetical protein
MGEGANQVSRDKPLTIHNHDQSAVASEHVGVASAEGSDETHSIRTGIEQTRADMSDTIDAIQDRLNPQHLKEQVKEQVREQFYEAKEMVRDATIGKAEEMVRHTGEAIRDVRYTVMDTIKENPIPAALVGIGLGWLFMNRRSAQPQRPPRYTDQRYYQQAYQPDAYANRSMYSSAGHQQNDSSMLEQGQQAVGETLHRAQEAVGDVASKAQQTVGNVVDQAQETAGYVVDQAQYQAQRVEDRFQQTLRDNPLAIGAVALALGTAVGFTLPRTSQENELLGDARDKLVDRAQAVAQDTMDKVRQVAGDVMDQAQTTAKEKAQEHGLTAE